MLSKTINPLNKDPEGLGIPWGKDLQVPAQHRMGGLFHIVQFVNRVKLVYHVLQTLIQLVCRHIQGRIVAITLHRIGR